MIPDACFFQKNGLSNNQMTNTMNQPIKDQETLKGIIDQYLNNGCDVAQPMVIIFDEDDSDRHELTDWLRNHEGKGLGVDGHPFKRGHRHFINENGVWVRVAAGKGTHRREAVYKFTEAAAGKGEYIQDAKGENIDANGVKWKKVDKGTGTHTGDFDYLYKDDGVKAVSDATKKKIEEANKIAKLTEDDKKDIYTKLGLTDEEMANTLDAARTSITQEYEERDKEVIAKIMKAYDKLHEESDSIYPLTEF